MTFANEQDAINALIEYAKSQEGYLEKASNSNLQSKTANAGKANWTKYGAYFGVNPAAWCDFTVDYCFCMVFGKETARKMLGGFSGYTPTSASYYEEMGRWYQEPKRGDQIFFHNSKRICHTGIVTGSDDMYVYTIEGNSGGGSEVIPNGGAVVQKKYLLNDSQISGYGRPKWELAISSKGYAKGWHLDDKGWWFADSPESYLHDTWKIINKCWYYFDEKGYAVKGAQKIGDELFYFCDTAGHPKECALMITNERGALEVWTVRG